MATTTCTYNYPCTSTIYPSIIPRDIIPTSTSILTSAALSSPSSTSTSIPLSSTQLLREEFWPYGGGVLIAFGICALIFFIIWLLDLSYHAKEVGLNVCVWIWGTWWTVVLWPFHMLVKVDVVLNRGLGRDREGRPRIPREMEEC